jgi:RNA polymerase sigma factor (sigma-70 family)
MRAMSELKKTLMERLFSEHRGGLQDFFRRRVKVDAQDLAQEVYVRILRLKDTQAIRNPELYLYTVANNLVKEHAVVERRLNTSDVDDTAIQQQLAELPPFDDDFDTDELVKRLRVVLAELPPKCRAAVVLQYRYGLSYEEIGGKLGVSTNMVKKYLAQALDHCRRRMSRLK